MARKPGERNFLEAALQNVEAFVDTVTENEAVKAVPILGTALKVCKGVDDLRNRALAAKIYKFLMEPALQSPHGKARLQISVSSSKEEADKLGETLFLTLEKFSDMRKPELLAQVFVAYLDEVIDLSMFRRIAAALGLAFVDDIESLLESPEDLSEKLGSEWKTGLLGSGLVSPFGGETYDDDGKVYFRLTQVARLFRQCVEHARSVAAQAYAV